MGFNSGFKGLKRAAFVGFYNSTMFVPNFSKISHIVPTVAIGDTSLSVLKDIHSKRQVIKGAGSRLKREKYPDEYGLSN